MAQMSSQSSGRAAVIEHRIKTLSNTAVPVDTTADMSLHWLRCDNSGNAATTYLKIYDADTADHATDAPALVLPVRAAFRGAVRVSYMVHTAVINAMFRNGVTVAASSSKQLDGAAPAAPFNVRIGID